MPPSRATAAFAGACFTAGAVFLTAWGRTVPGGRGAGRERQAGGCARGDLAHQPQLEGEATRCMFGSWQGTGGGEGMRADPVGEMDNADG